MPNKNSGLKNIRALTLAAMLTALSVVIGIFCKNFLNFGNGLFRITFENFPIILSGILLGPAVGAAVGAVSDILSFFLSTQSFVISPLVTLGAALVGLVSGLAFRWTEKRSAVVRTVFAVFCAHLVGSLLVKSIGVYPYYGWLVLWRLPTYAVIATLETLLLCILQKHRAFDKIFRMHR